MSSDTEKPIIFISCGQSTNAERELGRKICDKVRQLTQCEPYFAEYQSTVEGLSREILGTLHRAAGVICVMHKRGVIATPTGDPIIRGSVWIEQEIAIVAFMKQVLDRPNLEILFYAERGVSREGIRTVLHLNPKLEFNDGEEVLAHLEEALPKFKPSPYSAYDLKPWFEVETVSNDPFSSESRLWAGVENVGQEPVTDVKLTVWVPRFLLEVNRMTRRQIEAQNRDGFGDVDPSPQTHKDETWKKPDSTPLRPGGRLELSRVTLYDYYFETGSPPLNGRMGYELISSSLSKRKKDSLRIHELPRRARSSVASQDRLY
ncbi:MAG: hypothetical protein U0Q16_03135 [Bryobacteraceae bacterium]